MPLTQVSPGMLDSTAQYYSFKNRIINGAMVIDQRNAGASVTPTSGQFSVDRWYATLTQASKFSLQQNAGAVTPPTGFVKYLGATSLSAYSVVAGDLFTVAQQIEGLNVTDLSWGTANAATVTLSFWVRSSLTGTHAGNVQNYAQTQSYVFTYTISAANTWEQKTVTIVGPTSGTWATDNTSFAFVRFNLGIGSTYQTATTNAWVSGNFWSTSGAVSVVATNGATFYITGVQLEKGSTATSFDYRPYGTEFDLCRRYCEVYSGSADADGIPQYPGPVDVNNRPEIFVTYYTKRAAPSITVTNASTAFQINTMANTVLATTAYNGTSVGTGLNASDLFWTVASGMTTNTLSGIGMLSFKASARIIIDSEL